MNNPLCSTDWTTAGFFSGPFSLTCPGICVQYKSYIIKTIRVKRDMFVVLPVQDRPIFARVSSKQSAHHVSMDIGSQTLPTYRRFQRKQTSDIRLNFPPRYIPSCRPKGNVWTRIECFIRTGQDNVSSLGKHAFRVQGHKQIDREGEGSL